MNNRFLVRDTGQCGVFNGVNSVVSVAHSPSLIDEDYIAVMLSIRPSITHPIYMTPFAKSNEYFIEASGTANSFMFQSFFNVDGSDRDSGLTSIKLVPNQYNTIVTDYCSDTHVIRFFVNGILNVSKELTGLGTYKIKTSGNNGIYIGNRDGFARNFKGDIDRVIVKAGGTPLTSSDVSRFHYGGIIPSDPSLNIEFDGNLNDSSVNVNNGNGLNIEYSDDSFFSLRPSSLSRLAASGRLLS